MGITLELYTSIGGGIILCYTATWNKRSVVFGLDGESITKAVYGEGGTIHEMRGDVNLAQELRDILEAEEKYRRY